MQSATGPNDDTPISLEECADTCRQFGKGIITGVHCASINGSSRLYCNCQPAPTQATIAESTPSLKEESSEESLRT